MCAAFNFTLHICSVLVVGGKYQLVLIDRAGLVVPRYCSADEIIRIHT